MSIRARVAAWCAGLAVLTGTIGVVVTLAMTSTGLRNAARQTPLPPPDLATPGPRAATDSGGGVRLPPVPDPLSTPQGRRNEGNRVDRVIDSSRWRGLLTVAGLTCASVLAAWWAAGRMLRPIRRMTATAHEVTAPGSGRRIAIEGPPDELHDLADTIDGMLDRLDQSFASQRRFVADASHELRTPLAVITTEVDVALDNRNASSEDLRDSLRRVHGALGRTARLVESLLHLSRAEAAPIRLPHDLADSAEEAVAIVKRLAIAPPRTEADLASAPLSGDPVLLDRLVLNLVENACRYNIDGGFVRITTRLGAPAAERATGSGSFLVVENSGPVIDPEEVHRLFERFRRGSREANRRQGSDGNGLGLAIAKAVVDSHGGAITLAARPEGGLRVEVRFPGPCSA